MNHIRSRTNHPIALLAFLVSLTILALLSGCRGEQTPTIHNVILTPAIPLAGQPVTITWDVSGADYVDLQPFVSGLPADQKAYTFTSGFAAPSTLYFVARRDQDSAVREMIIPILATATPIPATAAAASGTPLPSLTPTFTLTPSPTPWPTNTPTPVAVYPIIQTWSATPLQVSAGQAVTLRWSVAQADSVIIEPFGQQPSQGQLIDFPTSNRAYNLIANNRGLQVSQAILVVVATPTPSLPVIRTFTANPTTAIRGYTQSFRLTWDVSGADWVSIEPGLGQVNSSGHRDQYPPAQDTVYTLTAHSSAGDVRAQVMVKVVDPSCTTLTPWSDLYPGPGVAFGPPLLDLNQGAILIPHNYNKMGANQGNWVYVTVQKSGQKGWTADKSGFLQCNIDITRLPAAPVPFTVSKVSITTSAQNYVGPCPVTIRSTARIEVTGPGRITFRWLRSDGISEPNQSYDYAAAGYKDFTFDWPINNIVGNYWVALGFSQPSSFTTNQTGFSVTCVVPTVKPYP